MAFTAHETHPERKHNYFYLNDLNLNTHHTACQHLPRRKSNELWTISFSPVSVKRSSFHLASSGTMSAFLIIFLLSYGLAVIFELVIGLFTITKLRESKTGYELKYLFILSFVIALLDTITIILIILIFLSVPEGSGVSAMANLHFLTLVCYLAFFMTQLGTLVARLHITFRRSTLQMTKKTIYFFRFIFILLFIVCITILILTALHTFFGFFKNPKRGIVIWILFWVLFFVGAVMAITLFVLNMFELTKLQCDDLPDLDAKAEDISLNSRQQKTLHLAAKYISLFSMASLASIVCVILHLLPGDYQAIGSIVFPVDLCINLLCLHLQFGFADQCYQKWCCCWDSCCTALVHREAKRSILDESQSSMVRVRASSDTMDTATDTATDTNSKPLIDESESEESAEI